MIKSNGAHRDANAQDFRVEFQTALPRRAAPESRFGTAVGFGDVLGSWTDGRYRVCRMNAAFDTRPLEERRRKGSEVRSISSRIELIALDPACCQNRPARLIVCRNDKCPFMTNRVNQCGDECSRPSLHVADAFERGMKHHDVPGLQPQ